LHSLQFSLVKRLQLWWHLTCTSSAEKVNSMLNGTLKSCLASGISVRSFQNKCLGISQTIKYTQAIKIGVSLRMQSTKTCCTGPHTSTRGCGCPACSPCPDVAPIGRVMKEQFALQKRWRASTGHPPHDARLCGNLTHLQEPINSAVTAMKRPKVCHIWGKPAYSKCGMCNVTLHYFTRRGANAGMVTLGWNALYSIIVMPSLDWQNKMQQL
jgi:hypothetical protein